MADGRAMDATIALAIIHLRSSYRRVTGAVITQIGFAGRQTEPAAPILVNLMVAIGLRSVVYVVTVAHQTVLG